MKGWRARDIKRRGKIVAQLEPPKTSEQKLNPWERVRAEVAGTMCHFEPGESALHDEDFETLC